MVDFPAIGCVCILWELTLSSHQSHFPPSLPISPTLTIQSPSPSAALVSHTLPRLSPSPKLLPHLVVNPRHVGIGRGPQRTQDRLKQWKNEKRQNNAANPGRAFVTLAPGPLFRGRGGSNEIFLVLRRWMMRKGGMRKEEVEE